MNRALHISLAAKAFMFSVLMAFAVATPSHAQEVTAEHTAAAKAAMKATGATERLDKILPEIAAFVKTGLIANRPDIEAEISATVDEVALTLAPRRGPLEDEVAAVYTKMFTQQELEEIESFFSGETGRKFLQLTPQLFRQIDETSKVWRGGIARDMSIQVEEKLKEAGLQ